MGLLLSQVFKVMVGRLRPNFLARCQPDVPEGLVFTFSNITSAIGNPEIQYPCTNPDHDQVDEGRLAFPSGGRVGLLAGWLAGRCRGVRCGVGVGVGRLGSWAPGWQPPRDAVRWGGGRGVAAGGGWARVWGRVVRREGRRAAAIPATALPLHRAPVPPPYRPRTAGHTSICFNLAVYASGYLIWVAHWRQPALPHRLSFWQEFRSDLVNVLAKAWMLGMLCFAWGVGISRCAARAPPWRPAARSPAARSPHIRPPQPPPRHARPRATRAGAAPPPLHAPNVPCTTAPCLPLLPTSPPLLPLHLLTHLPPTFHPPTFPPPTSPPTHPPSPAASSTTSTTPATWWAARWWAP